MCDAEKLRSTTFGKCVLMPEGGAKPVEGFEMARLIGLRGGSQRVTRFTAGQRFGDLPKWHGRAFEPAELELGCSPGAFTRIGAPGSRDSGFGDFELISPGAARVREARFERGQIGSRSSGRSFRRGRCSNTGTRRRLRRFGGRAARRGG